MNLHDAQKLMGDTMRAYGLLDMGWTQRFDNGVKRFGMCDHGARRLSLSRHLVTINPEHIVAEVILHEIAHALVGPGHGHDAVWKAKARQLGIAGDRCWSPGKNGAKALAPKHVGTCRTEGCDFVIKRERLTASTRTAACPRCCKRHNGGRHTTEFLLVWREFRLQPQHIRDRVLA